MDLIAKECGISKRTLYEVFSDKNTLVIEAVNIVYDDRNVIFQNIIDTSESQMVAMLRIYISIRDFIKGICPSFFIDMDRLYPTVAKNYKDIEDRHIERFVNMLDKGKDEGVFRKDANSHIVAALYVMQMQNIKKSKDLFSSSYSFVEVYDTIFISFMRGIATQRGLELIDNFLEK